MDATVDIFDDKRREFHLDRYRFAARRVPGKQVLDCACGTGYGARLLLEQGLAKSVIGVDIDAQAIQYAWQHHNAGAALFVCAPGERLPFAEASVDVITSFETIEHVPDDEALVQEFHRILCPGGLLIVSTPNQWPLADTPYHVREYDRALFLSVLESRFHCLELYNQNSGSPTPLNHDQPRGIVKTTLANQDSAECFVAVCQRPTMGLGDNATRLTSISSLFTE
jgi:2-polyprenyl-3-methyl-5-hydroxy-6-metoxy-1,4-benzoquinol methylase